MKKFNLNLISRYRTELMGLATIGIIVCHTKANGVVMPNWLWFIFQFGSVGTAIFLFLSGVGIWYSLRKIEYERFLGGGVISWYKKRYIKLFIPFLIIALPYYAYMTICEGHSFWSFIWGITTVEYWISGGGVWFVSVIAVLYLLSPWWSMLIHKTGWNMFLSILAFLTILLCGKWINHSSRICFYFLGFGLAPYIEKGLSIKWLPLLACSALLYIACLLPALDFFPRYVFYVPFGIILPCIFFNTRWSGKKNFIWRFMGNISLESYLTNIFLPTFFIQSVWIKNYHGLICGNNLGYFLVIIVGVILSYLSHQLSGNILSKIYK